MAVPPTLPMKPKIIVTRKISRKTAGEGSIRVRNPVSMKKTASARRHDLQTVQDQLPERACDERLRAFRVVGPSPKPQMNWSWCQPVALLGNPVSERRKYLI
jgi:hypothetical protein